MRGFKFRLFREKGKEDEHQMRMLSLPLIYFFWPVAFVGFVFPLLDNWVSVTFLSWAYAAAWFISLMAVCEDIDLDRLVGLAAAAAILILSCALIWALGWAHYFGGLGRFIARLDMMVGGGFPLIVSIGFSIWIAIRLMLAKMRRVWRINHLQIEHLMFWKSDLKFTKDNYNSNFVYPSLLRRWLGFGAGDIEILDKDRHVVCVASNLWGLARRASKIDAILANVGVTEENQPSSVVVKPVVEPVAPKEDHVEAPKPEDEKKEAVA